MVALLAEGVDRNCRSIVALVNLVRSPSSRRAWIEMLSYVIVRNQALVALLAEGVDRNCVDFACQTVPGWSPSSRRAWIEIFEGR